MKRKLISLLTAAAMVFAALPVVAENTDGVTEEVTAIEETVSVDTETEIVDEEETDSETEEILPIEEEEQSVDVSSVTLEVQSTSGTCGDDLTWELDDDGVLTISGTGDMEDYSSSGAPWYSNCESITDVEIGDEVTSIGSYAFYNCTALMSITVPNSVISIGSSAFNGCSALEEITLPFVGSSRDATNTSDAVFGYIFGTELYSESNSTKQYYRNSAITPSSYYKYYYIPICLTKVTITDATQIPYGAFYNCVNIADITISDSVTNIREESFYGCSGLKEITLPFVGSSRDVSETYDAVFGYIFGTPSYTGSSSTKQYYSSNSYRTSYIPDSLVKVTITDATQISYGAFYNCSNITDIIISDIVTSIGSYAFYNCTGLASVTIPGSITSIDSCTFYNCSGLTSITIPDSVTSIETKAFYNCSALTSAIIPDSVINIGESIFSGCSILEEITLPFVGSSRDASKTSDAVFGYIFGSASYTGSSSIKQYYSSDESLTYCIPSSLTKVTITDSTQIPYGAFYNCKKLTDITILGSTTSIGEYAFSNCTGLTNITNAIIPDSVVNIGKNAFYSCTGIENVYISDIASWLKISFGNEYSNPMNYASNVYIDEVLSQNITIPDETTQIPAYAFYGWKSLNGVEISNSVTSVGDSAFENCTGLTNVTLGTGITNIGDSAFSGCTALENVYAPDIESWLNITFSDEKSTPMYYADNVYIDGKTLRSIIVPDGITAISAYAFYNWTTLSNIIISDSVKSIGEKAFYNCVRLANITLGNGITSIGADAFAECSSLENVYVPSIEAWLNISFSSEASTPMYYASNIYVNGETVSSVTVPNSITEISPYAFYNWTTLNDVTMSDSVTDIGTSAFYGCNQLTDVTLGGELTSVGSNAFQNCSALSNVYIADVDMWLNVAFDNDYSNPMRYAKSIYIDGKLVKDVTISDSITEIPSSAFYNWYYLESVTIPDSVTSIGKGAFYNCKSLTNVTILGGVTEIGDYAFRECSALSNIYIPDLETWFNITFGNAANPMYYIDSNPMCFADNMYIDGELAVDVTIPDDIEEIPSYAFYNWGCLENVTIPSTVASVGTYAFSNCDNLTSVIIGSGITNISDYAFYKCTGLTSVSMTRSVTDVGENAFSGTNVFVVYFEGDEDDWDYILWGDGNDTIQNATLIYNGDPSIETVIKSGTCNDTVSWTLSNFGNLVVSGTGTIPDYTSGSAPWYSYANNIKSIIIEDGITGIGDYAFYYIGTAKNITIPSSVTAIGSSAFYNCSAVDNLYIEDISAWMNIDFENGTANPMLYAKNVYVDNALTTAIEIPSGTEAIKAYAFYGNGSLTSVSIPTSVTSIASSAFTNCSALNGISYDGSETEWQQISGYNSVSSVITVYYDGVEVPTPTVIPIQTPTVMQTETDDAWSFEVTLETTYANSTVFAAAYDANGALIGMSVTDLQTDGATTVLLKKYTDADIVKVFVWSDTTQPITTVWESEIV